MMMGRKKGKKTCRGATVGWGTAEGCRSNCAQGLIEGEIKQPSWLRNRTAVYQAQLGEKRPRMYELLWITSSVPRMCLPGS